MGRPRGHVPVQWKVVSVQNPDDSGMVGRGLAEPDGRTALKDGFYPEGASILITSGKYAGRYTVRGRTLVDEHNLRLFAAGKHAKLNAVNIHTNS